MEDQQNQQNKNLQQLNPYELLDDFGKQIVDLRLEGWKYKRLESVAKKKEQTIRTWFMQGGEKDGFISTAYHLGIAAIVNGVLATSTSSQRTTAAKSFQNLS